MRKITSLIIFMLIFGLANVFSGVVTTDQYKFLFNGVWTSTVPAGTVTVGTTTTAASTLFNIGSGSVPSVTSNYVYFSGAATSGNRGSAISNLNAGTTLSTTKKEVVEFDWFVYSNNADAMGYNVMGVSDGTSKPVFILMAEKWSSGGTTGFIHLMNLTPAKLTIGTTTSIVAATYTGTSDYRTDCANYYADSKIGADFTNNNSYHVKAKLDFSTHTIDSIWITRSSFSYLGTNIAFLSASASNLNLISAAATRGKNQTNSANGSSSTSAVNQQIDNYYVYTWETASTANVTVNYYDVDNPATLITSSVRGSQAIGGTYTSTGADQASFSNGGYYCVYSSSALDNVSITADGLAHVDLLMKKYPVVAATYQWTGTANGNWNELDGNFTDGTNTLGYQPGNGLSFPESASNKTVTVNSNFNLGASTNNDLTINGDGYSLQGSGTLTGGGNLNVNLSGAQTLTLNVTNNLTGVAQIAGGNITLSKSGALGASTVNVTGATTFISGANAVTIPATTFGVSSSIQTGTNNSNVISGITAGNGVKISVTSGYNHASSTATAFDFAASGTLSAGSEIELNGSGTDNRIGMTSASSSYLANTKLTLKGATLFYLNVNQGASSTVSVGTLAGDATTRLGWGKSSALGRNITWSVGGSNQSSEFAGTITNLGGYAQSGSSYTGDFTHLTKVGTGVLTLSGTSTAYNGNLTVNDGELIVSGTIQGNNQQAAGSYNNGPKADTITVAAGKKLTVSGSLTATNLTLNSDANGTATLVNTGTVSIVNPAVVKQYLTAGRNWYISSPVTAATAAALSTATTVYRYNEPTAEWVALASGDALVPGQGYISGTTTTSSAITFTGTLNDGNVPVTLSRSGATKAGFNLVGNPYPSYLNWKACIEDAANVADANVGSTVWYRTKNAGGTYKFATYNGTSNLGTDVDVNDKVTGNIPPMQAFWVRVNEGQTSGTLTFKNSMRAHKGTQLQGDDVTYNDGKLRAPAALQQILRLNVSNGINDDEAILLFNQNASDGIDAYDSYKMSNNTNSIPEIYTSVSSEDLVINGMSGYTYNTSIPLGFKTGETNTYTIAASQVKNFDTDTKIILVDNTTSTQTDLTAGESYTFTSDATTTSTRFSVLFKSATGTTDVDNALSALKVYTADNRIVVENNSKVLMTSSVEVFNAIGQKLYSQLMTANKTQIIKEFAAGVYVVKVNNGLQSTATRLIIR